MNEYIANDNAMKVKKSYMLIILCAQKSTHNTKLGSTLDVGQVAGKFQSTNSLNRRAADFQSRPHLCVTDRFIYPQLYLNLKL